MAEYIGREKVKNILEAKAEMASGTPKEVFYNAAKMLELIPAADVVEVVRCKDCKFAFPYRNYYYCENEDSPFTNSDWAVCPNGDDFCSYGERKE